MGLPIRVFVGQLNHVTAMPLRINDGNVLIGQNAFDGCSPREVFELCHWR